MSQVKTNPQIHQPRFEQNRQHDKYKNVPKPYMKVAESYEKMFANHLLSQMNNSVDTAEPQSQATQIYKGMLNDERAQIMAESKHALGIKDLVLDEIYPHYKRQNVNNNHQAVQMYKQAHSQGENHE